MPEQEKRKRPVGVWILTLWLAVFAGLLPAAVSVVGLVHGAISVVQFTLMLALNLGVMAASVSAWTGSATGRNILATLAIVYYLGVAVSNYQLAVGDDVPADKLLLF